MSAPSEVVRGVFLLSPAQFENIYGPDERRQISTLVTIPDQVFDGSDWERHGETLAQAKVIFSGWGMPKVTEDFLAAAPNLEAIFYGAGSIRGFMTDAAWDRGVFVCSAWAFNAVPVAEFNLAQILLAMKRAWPTAYAVRESGAYPAPRARVAGNYRSVVGIVSMGMTGRILRRLLRPFDHRVITYDPFLSAEDAAELGVELVGLEELFSRSDVVSLNTPLLPETIGLVTGPLIASMKPGATFINTARGAIVDEPAMIEVLKERPDLFAILDVTWPEPPEAGSPLYNLPNVALTPHIAGSMNDECRRMGQAMIDECRRFLAGQPLQHAITREMAARLA